MALPVFDLILLGMGEDGHTASIFPRQISICLIRIKYAMCHLHPVSRQKRITITGQVINNAEHIRFLITGRNKAEILKKILKKEKNAKNFPASLVVPSSGNIEWLIDAEAGSLL